MRDDALSGDPGSDFELWSYSGEDEPCLMGKQTSPPPAGFAGGDSPAGRLVNARVTGHADAEANCPR
ncbi:hypothetical protein T484DRAFT_1911756 [Baffinella frigidus]|nr:hypothetical protein T484DRAFT_1911756 [Cryptophyta sp. CCMP2293]